MAEYSWVALIFKSVDPEIVGEVERLFGDGGEERENNDEWTRIAGETSYGMAEEAEGYLTEKDVEWHRFSDGKYEYDGDEGHFIGGKIRLFSRLNNGGRVFTEGDLSVREESSDAELGAAVREHFGYAKEFEEVQI